MKKIVAGILVAMLVLCVGTTSAFAAGKGWGGGRGTGRVGAAGSGYVDADGDGICDNCAGSGYVDADGDGICDNRAAGMQPRKGWNGGTGMRARCLTK